MSKKKIIYVWKSPYPWDVRVEKICKSLAKEYEVLILARWGGEQKKAEQIDGITIKRVGFREKSYKSIPLSANPLWKKELKATIKGFKPDLIIVREIMLGTLVGKLGKKFNIPTVMDMAENYPAVMKLWRKYNNNFIKKFLISYLNLPKKVEKNSINRMKAILVVCEEQIPRLNECYKYPTSNIRIIKNTPEYKFIELESQKVNNKVTFLHHGWLTEEKRIDNFIVAFIKAFKNDKNFQLNIAGTGNCLDEYQCLAKDVKNIMFIGEYNHLELESIISESTIGILPYESNDFNNYTIHNKIFDYFSLSKPVIVSEVRPISRIVKNANAGFIVDCSEVEPIVKFLLSVDFKNVNQLSSNAYNAYVTKYNWQEDEKKLLNFIGEII